MNRLALFLVTFICFNMSQAQNPFQGTFLGELNGDRIVMTLLAQGNSLTGKMQDSQQTYEVTATQTGNRMQGQAVEQSLNLTFVLDGTLSGAELNMKMTVTVFGISQDMQVVFLKQGGTANTGQAPTGGGNTGNTMKLPPGKSVDPRIVGNWKREEMYNSGYGDNYMSANTVYRMAFNADGTMVDGGSQATISGGNYYGNSGGSQSQVVPNVLFYTENSNIYLIVNENGTTQTVLLGRYYIENSSLLITAQNGTKQLYTR